jgi:hypothetical protein
MMILGCLVNLARFSLSHNDKEFETHTHSPRDFGQELPSAEIEAFLTDEISMPMPRSSMDSGTLCISQGRKAVRFDHVKALARLVIVHFDKGR